MKRILHVVTSLSQGSGIMSFVMNYYRHINRECIQFDFLYFNELENNYKEEIKKLGGKYYKISKPSLSYNFYNEVDEFLKNNSNNYDAIHCHPIFSSSFIGIFKNKYNIKHIIQHSHTSKSGSSFISKIRNKIILMLSMKYITELAACSPEAMLLFGNKQYKFKKRLVINNSIDYKRFSYDINNRKNIRKKYNINNDTVVIGHVGRFSKEKNHELLIEIFNKYHSINKNSKLILIGDGVLKEKIKCLVDKLELTNDVIFIGNIPNVEKYYSAMDVFILPSNFEGFGLVAIESQINGLITLVSSNVPSCVAISSNIFYCGKIHDYIEILTKIDFNKKNRENNNINFKYNVDNNVKMIEKFYEEL